MYFNAPPYRPRRGQSHFFTTWRQGNWKVRYDYFAQGDDRYGLYNLASDPSESNNLVYEQPEQLKAMMQRMVQELESMNAVYPVMDNQIYSPIIRTGKHL